jgi:uncharacterized protein YbaR (Trm112 family)
MPDHWHNIKRHRQPALCWQTACASQRCTVPCRYDAQQQLLINDDLGVGYPVVNGVPYLVPTRGKMLQQQQQADNS